MATYDLGKDRPENEVEFLIWRAQAIEAYAQVEQSLSTIFANLLGTSLQLAGIVFFRLTNTHSRNAIIASLLEKRHGTKFDAFWFGIPNSRNKRGLINLINDLDQRRNEIVHWHTVNNVTVEDDKAKGLLALGKPNFWTLSSDSRFIGVSDMQQFVAKAGFVTRSINMFSFATMKEIQITEPARSAWHDIFQQPCIYPPLDTHPLSPNYKAHEIPPQPSEA